MKHAPPWGIKHSLPSNTLLLKTHSKDYSHRKFCKQDNFINFYLKNKTNQTKKHTHINKTNKQQPNQNKIKETQNKTC